MAEPRHVGQGGVGGVIPGFQRGGCRKGKIGSCGGLTEFLKEREEVSGVVGIDHIAAKALTIREFPAAKNVLGKREKCKTL